VTRHPSVTANAIVTLDQLAPGRTTLGIGVGDSAVQQAGTRPAKLPELRQAIEAIRALVNGVAVDWAGPAMKPAWLRRAVPIVVAASGPKALQLAGAIADGVCIGVGMSPAFYRWARSQVEVGLRSSGRDASSIHVVRKLYLSIHEDRSLAI